jgi:hypothetical protein
MTAASVSVLVILSCVVIIMVGVLIWYFTSGKNKKQPNVYVPIERDTARLIPRTIDIFIYPISFSIPKTKIISYIPLKQKTFAHIIPGNLKTYIFQDEPNYYKDYEISIYGHTQCKAGWDCLRHYEILANGCIPWFKDLQNCPKQTMTHFPKNLVHSGMNSLYNTSNNNYRNAIEKLLSYTRDHLTTEAMASYMLNAVGFATIKSVLFLSGDTSPDYLRCLTLHGLKELFKTACHDHPIIPHLYTNCSTSPNNLYGKGFTYSKLLNASMYRNDKLDSTVLQDIAEHKYDIVIYGSIKRGMPLWDLVNEHYEKNEILLLYGEDAQYTEAEKTKYVGYHLFCRELI